MKDEGAGAGIKEHSPKAPRRSNEKGRKDMDFVVLTFKPDNLQDCLSLGGV